MCICFLWSCHPVGNASPPSGLPHDTFPWRKLEEHFSLILASNRDEFFSRPTKPPHAWAPRGRPDIYAGIDLEAGGTWLGVNRSGRFGVLTNFRSPKDDSALTTSPSAAAPACSLLAVTGVLSLLGRFGASGVRPGLAAFAACLGLHLALIKSRRLKGVGGRDSVSRGRLIDAFLRGSQTPLEFAESIGMSKYAGFNVIVGSAAEEGGGHVYASNRASAPVVPLSRGCYALSNATLDVPWGKLVRGKARFIDVLRSWCEEGEERAAESLARRLVEEVLKDQEQCEVQVTGCAEAFERELARVCCPGCVTPDPARAGQVFGTTAHMVVMVERRSGRVRVFDQCRSSHGDFDWGGWNSHEFDLLNGD